MTFKTRADRAILHGSSRFQEADKSLFTTLLFSVEEEAKTHNTKYIDISITKAQAIQLAGLLKELLNKE